MGAWTVSFVLDFVDTYWTILALTAILIGIRHEVQRRYGRSHIVSEASLLYAAYFCYYMVRGLVKDQASLAKVNARLVIDMQEWLGIFIEPQVQKFSLRHDWLIDLMNWIYVWLHWPVIAIVLVWLFINVPNEYLLYRNAILVSGALALLVFAFFPVAPPRFMPQFGFVDTIEQRSYSQHVLLPSGLANKYAAVPSLHAGWNLLMAMALYRNARNVAIRAFAIALPILMTLSIVLTGNHYLLDAVAGDLIALAGLYIAFKVFRSDAPGESPPASRPPEIAVPSL